MKVSEMFDGFLSAEDLPEGREIKLTILGVREASGKDKGLDGKKLENPIIAFKGVKKEAVLNRTNAKTIRRIYGNETDAWIGKEITVFRTTCKAFGEIKQAWRVKEAMRQL